MPRVWKVANQMHKDALQDIHPSWLVRQLLWNRGIQSVEGAQVFLKPDYGRDLHDPFLFRDMERAVERILRAVDEKETIVIHGDYDADGVCASAILATTLELLGASPHVHLPHRLEDGYGVSMNAIEQFLKMHAQLLITVDCGIANREAIGHAASHQVDTIVVDHHRAPKRFPPAHAILHCDIPGEPYPFRKLSAGGVAFKLAQAIVRTARFKTLHLSERNVEAFEKWLLDLVAISTVADVMPLIGENRTLVHYGLRVLSRSRRVGLIALMRRAGLLKYREDVRENERMLRARDIAFGIAPRLNAAGRMAHASLAYDLLRVEEDTRVDELVQELERVNQQRQRATDAMYAEALIQMKRLGDTPIIVVANNDWSVGLVGLLAGKLADEYARPVFAIGNIKGRWTGSCRAVPGFDCISTLEGVAPCLMRWGGHTDAAGFTLRNDVTIEAFRNALIVAVLQGGFSHHRPHLDIDARAGLEEVGETTVETLESFAPFGEGNPSPLILTTNCRVCEVSTVGRDNMHVKCMVVDEEGARKRAIAFHHMRDDEGILKEGAVVDIVYEPRMNTWNGKREVELHIKDSRLSE
ncbi:MAG: single-stranded-DNA-specific exonuclease RecJ [Patescibacteria group bacterium]